MTFPDPLEVEAASRYQLCVWHRRLPSAATEQDQATQQRIFERWKEVGEFTPELSRGIGW